MKELMVFCLFVLETLVDTYLNFDLGAYSYGAFLVTCIIVSVLIGSLVITFRGSGGSAGQTVRPHKTRANRDLHPDDGD